MATHSRWAAVRGAAKSRKWLSNLLLFSHVRLCDRMNCSTPGFPVLHYLPESTQTHVHWVSDAVQPSHPLSPSSPLALNLSHHQGLFKWVSSSPEVAKVIGALASAPVLPVNNHGRYPLGLTGLNSLLSKGFSRVSSSTTIWKHNSSPLSLLYGPNLTPLYDYWKNHSFEFTNLCRQSDISAF